MRAGAYYVCSRECVCSLVFFCSGISRAACDFYDDVWSTQFHGGCLFSDDWWSSKYDRCACVRFSMASAENHISVTFRMCSECSEDIAWFPHQATELMRVLFPHLEQRNYSIIMLATVAAVDDAYVKNEFIPHSTPKRSEQTNQREAHDLITESTINTRTLCRMLSYERRSGAKETARRSAGAIARSSCCPKLSTS